MAVGLWIQFSDTTEEQYEAMNSQMRVEEDPPEGLIFHSAGPNHLGWSIIDFWESRELFDSFQADRLGAAIQALGDQAPDPPEIKEFPVHNILKP